MTWTPKDQTRAARQGWLILAAPFLGEDRLAIQRVDDPQAFGIRQPHNACRFKSDEAAEAYVRGRADAGCALARKALRCSNHVHRSTGRASDWNNLGPSRKAPSEPPRKYGEPMGWKGVLRR